MLQFYAIQVPVPPNTARCFIHVGMGRAKYEPEQRAIVWRIKRMIGGSEAVFAAEVELTPSIREKAWSRPPIQVALHYSITVWMCFVFKWLCRRHFGIHLVESPRNNAEPVDSSLFPFFIVLSDFAG